MDLTSKWSIALYGWMAYNLIVWYVEKQKSDRTSTSFDWPKYFTTHYDDWIVTLFFAYPVVERGPEIHQLILTLIDVISPVDVNIPWSDVFYAGPGPLVQLLYFLATKLWPAMKKRTVGLVSGGVVMKKSDDKPSDEEIK